MISQVFSPEIETREPGTFRYLILYRKSVEGGEQEPVLITDISPRALSLSRAPFTYVSHPLPSSSVSRAHPPSFLSLSLSLSSSLPPPSFEIHTHVYVHARTPPRRSISDLGTETSREFPPGTLSCLYAVAVSVEGIGTWGLMFRN